MAAITDALNWMREDLTSFPFEEGREIRRALNVHAALKGLNGDKLRVTYLLSDFKRSFSSRGAWDLALTITLIVQKRIGTTADGSTAAATKYLELVEQLIEHYTDEPLQGKMLCGEAKAETLYDPDHADNGVFTAMLTLPFELRKKNVRS